MSDFTLDTSGIVAIRHSDDGLGAANPQWGAYSWDKLTPFMQGYVGVALAGDVSLPDGAVIPRTPLGFSDLAPATLSAMMSDCAEEVARWASPHLATGHNGGEFWEARQTGTFTGARAHLQPVTLYLGDDGLIHHRVAS